MLFNQHSGLSSILIMHDVPSCWALGMHVHCSDVVTYPLFYPHVERPGYCFSNAIVTNTSHWNIAVAIELPRKCDYTKRQYHLPTYLVAASVAFKATTSRTVKDMPISESELNSANRRDRKSAYPDPSQWRSLTWSRLSPGLNVFSLSSRTPPTSNHPRDWICVIGCHSGLETGLRRPRSLHPLHNKWALPIPAGIQIGAHACSVDSYMTAAPGATRFSRSALGPRG